MMMSLGLAWLRVFVPTPLLTQFRFADDEYPRTSGIAGISTFDCQSVVPFDTSLI
jgi:hypothetical protein